MGVTSVANHAISSCHEWATQAARSAIADGGNVIDAAVTAAFVLQVVEPHLNGPAGELVALVHTGDTSEPICISGVGSAPAASTIRSFHTRGYELVPAFGVASAPVPGQFHALISLLDAFGTFTLAQALGPAHVIARQGFPVTDSLHEALAASTIGAFARWPRTRDFWLPGGVPKPGASMCNTVLARTFSTLIDVSQRAAHRRAGLHAALEYWYQGPIAEAIESHTKEWAPKAAGAGTGLLTAQDLADHTTAFERPILGGFREYTVVKAGPWTQGPVQPLALSIFDGALDGREADEAEVIHTLIESIRLAMADRDAYLGDGATCTQALLAPEYVRTRASFIESQAAQVDDAGILAGLAPWRPPLRDVDAPLSQAPWAMERLGFGDTCHISIIDRRGNAIALTASGGWLQSSPIIERLGFSLSTRLQQTWLDPESPSSLRPGKRPRVTLTPTLVLVRDEPVLSLGSPGGDGQDQWQLHALIRMLHFGLSAEEAVRDYAFQSLSFHNSFWPRERVPKGLLLEATTPPHIADDLRKRGHRIFTVPPNTLGRLSIVGRDKETGALQSAVSPRSGYAQAVII